MPMPLIKSAMNAITIRTIVSAREMFCAATRMAVNVRTLYSAPGMSATQQ